MADTPPPGVGPSGPDQSPLYHAQHSDRYERQALIQEYQRRYECRLVVVFDAIFPYSLNFFEDLVYDADPAQALHLLLATPGGDGESALRLVRSAQARCREMVVIVPDLAKSAGTLIALGAHRILMGPTSDLGPVDPQFSLNPQNPQELSSAKDLIAAVDQAVESVQKSPDTYALHAALLAPVNALMVQQARSALARTGDLALEALQANPARTPAQAKELWETKLCKPLMEESRSHAATFGVDAAIETGLPVEKVDPSGPQWELIWRLWMKYFVRNERIYEGERASHALGLWQQPG